jgi:metal-responsive CopG/Arc/MetJ family transcriptional regulator
VKTIQVVLDAKLLQAADRVANRRNINRSALIRDALRSHLKRLQEQELEEQERRAYLAQPQSSEEIEAWEKAAVWPENWTVAIFTSTASLRRTSKGLC